MPMPLLEGAYKHDDLCLDPIEWDGYEPGAERTSPTLEELIPESTFALMAEEDEARKGGRLRNTLQIDFQTDGEGVWNMTSLDSGYRSVLPYRATNITQVTDSDRSYSGYILAADENVILKFAYDEGERARLCAEAGFYQNQLRRVQKAIVPAYIGHFGTADGETTCLVTRNVGEAIECYFTDFLADER
jgi:hypothetical protein